ncbi:MAG: hypothetical protein LBR11_12520 [Deltaproteobacteria bacterium]|jgi:hypothetical protein|nr:hypothetical protein [Deltaproteobacteria bacterium]
MKTIFRRETSRRVAGSAAQFFGLAGLILSLGLYLVGCGVKTHPYPESSSQPGPVRDLKPTLGEAGQLWLTWRAPLYNMANRPLRTLDHFEVWGADYPKKGFCEGCPVQYQKLAEVYPLAPPPGLTVAEGPYQWVTTIDPERAYRFRVAGYSTRGAVNPDSWREVTVYGQKNPGSLPRFAAVAEDLTVRLTWAKPGPGQRVEVQRRAPGQNWVTLAGLDGTSSAGADLEVVYGTTYLYRARLLAGAEEGSAPGPFSPEIQVLVEDTTPPRPVGFLDAALAEGGVRLRWESLALEETGLAGYRVYRRLEGETTFRPLGGLTQGNTYLDSEVQPGQTAYYQVTAVDSSPRANESRPSPVASALAAPPEEEPTKPEVRDPGL